MGVADEILFARDGVLWTVSPASAQAGARLGRARGRRQLHAVERPQADRVHARRADLDRVARPEDAAPGHRTESDDGVGSGLLAGRPVARLHVRRRRPAAGSRACCRSTATACASSATATASSPAARRSGGSASCRSTAATSRGFRRSATPSAVQFTADGSLLWAEGSASGKTREIKVWSAGGPARTLWKDQDERWFSPTGRDSKVLVSPDGKSVAFVSDRTGWIHVYVMPVNATSESQARAADEGRLSGGARRLVARQHADRLSPQRRRQSDGTLRRHRRCGVRQERADRHRARRQLRSVVLARRRQPGVPSHRRRELARPLHGRGARAVAHRAVERFDAGRTRQGRSHAAGRRVVSQPSRQEAGAGDADGVEGASIARRNIRRWSGFTARDRIRTFSAGIRAATGCITRSASTSRSRATSS